MGLFNLVSDFQLAGDQPAAVDALVEGVRREKKDQVLLGITGSGKTFTMAHMIARLEKPALIMAHNKTLAAQLYQEMKHFFPDNAVEYFVSYYDYYQPEAYVAKTDTFIEKDASINEQIDQMRHSATRSLIERRDVVVVSSVSCIYGIGAPELYSDMTITLTQGEILDRNGFLKQLVTLQYERHDWDFKRASFRVNGDNVDIFPPHTDERAWRVSFFGDEVDELCEFDPLTGETKQRLDTMIIYPSSHYVTPKSRMETTIQEVREELKARLDYYDTMGRALEYQRLQQRTQFDLEMMMTSGSCKGIENYSRYLSGRSAGSPPPTLFEYLPHDALLFIDESHVTVPQIGGMYHGDRSRKETLVEHGFRLPSALDNRPLRYEEWDAMRPSTVFVSATPGKRELELVKGEVVEQIIRPTGLLDPECIIRPATNQVDDLLGECKAVIAKGQRVLVTTLTKRMAEQLSEYMQEANIQVTYLHSDVTTLERIDIIQQLRRGDIDVLVGVNLLREGLDIPECSLVAILDADKEGFLRSEMALIQTIGRAARNVEGRAILYADHMTASMEKAISETKRRRVLQMDYNEAHGITPTSITKSLSTVLESIYEHDHVTVPIGSSDGLSIKDLEKKIEAKRKEMLEYAADLEFEKAAALRDEIKTLEEALLGAS